MSSVFDLAFLYTFFFFFVPIAARVAFTFVSTFFETFAVLDLVSFSTLVEPGWLISD